MQITLSTAVASLLMEGFEQKGVFSGVCKLKYRVLLPFW